MGIEEKKEKRAKREIVRKTEAGAAVELRCQKESRRCWRLVSNTGGGKNNAAKQWEEDWQETTIALL